MIIISLGKVNLGNNFNYSHFIDSLNGDQIDRIYSKEWELDSHIRLLAKGNYGRIRINTCGSDLSDHLRGH
jgi:hypothetical protein